MNLNVLIKRIPGRFRRKWITNLYKEYWISNIVFTIMFCHPY